MSDANDVTGDERPFGGCPDCGGNDGYRNLGPAQWMFCAAHRTRWQIGENLFSSWRGEGPEVWEQNARHLADYRVVGGDSIAPAVNTGGNKLCKSN